MPHAGSCQRLADGFVREFCGLTFKDGYFFVPPDGYFDVMIIFLYDYFEHVLRGSSFEDNSCKY